MGHQQNLLTTRITKIRLVPRRNLHPVAEELITGHSGADNSGAAAGPIGHDPFGAAALCTVVRFENCVNHCV